MRKTGVIDAERFNSIAEIYQKRVNLLIADGGEANKERDATYTLLPYSQRGNKYEVEGHAYYSSARLWDDGVLDPVQTRDVLGLCLAASLNAPIPPVKYGVYRM